MSPDYSTLIKGEQLLRWNRSATKGEEMILTQTRKAIVPLPIPGAQGQKQCSLRMPHHLHAEASLTKTFPNLIRLPGPGNENRRNWAMTYDEPVIRRTGDLALTVEFGDEISLPVSFRVIALSELMAKNPIPGVVETIPTHRSVGIVVDPNELGPAKMEAALSELIKEAQEVKRLVSRVVHIPMLYDDPWSRHCAEAHGHRNSVDLIAEANNMSIEEVVAVHSSTDYWVGALGFTPGCTQAFPLSEQALLVAPKLAVPRKWTYARIVALGGRLTAPYTSEVPGGYQMLGRTPLDWYDPRAKNPTYGDDIILCRVGDRQRFGPIDLAAYEEIRESVILGQHEYRVDHEERTLTELSRQEGASQ